MTKWYDIDTAVRMNGDVTIPSNPLTVGGTISGNSLIVNGRTVLNDIDGKLSLTGGTLTGALTLNAGSGTALTLGQGGDLVFTTTAGAVSATLFADTVGALATNASSLSLNGNAVWHAGNITPVPTSRIVTAGSGLTGGGDLTADRTLSVSFGGNGAATTVTRSDHNHDTVYTKQASSDNSMISKDTRNTNEAPQDRAAGLYADFKANSTNGLSDGGSFNGVLNFRKYASGTDFTGGQVNQLAVTDNNNLWIRTSTSATAWGSWIRFWHSANFDPATKVSTSTTLSAGNGLTGGGDLSANRSLAVDFTGSTGSSNAVARVDHHHDSTYLKLVGGALTGNLNMAGNILTFDSGVNTGTAGIASTDSGKIYGEHDVNTEVSRLIFEVFDNVDDALVLRSNVAGTKKDMVVVNNSTITFAVNPNVGGSVLWHAGNLSPVTTARQVIAGSGLTGGGDLSTNRTLSVSFAGTGSATTAAKSDHDHDSTYLKLDGTNSMSGALSTPTLFVAQSGQKYIGSFTTTKDIANQKLDLYFTGSFTGELDVTVTSGWNYGNATGVVVKRFGLNLTASTTINSQATKYIEAHGGIQDIIGISDLTWDATNNRWKIQLAQIPNAGVTNTYHVYVSAVTPGNISTLHSMALSAIYTTDIAIFSNPTPQLSSGTTVLGTLNLNTQASASTHAVRADRSISVGSGLTGGGDLTADRTLAVSFGGNGAATSASRSDHDHNSSYVKLDGTSSMTGKLYVQGGSAIGGTGSVTLALGDTDTGFNWVSDGVFNVYANNVSIATVNSSGINMASGKSLQVNGVNVALQTTSISAGSGLTGGGDLSANRTLSVSFAGTGAATTVSRSDHDHSSTYLGITATAADSSKLGGQVSSYYAVASTLSSHTGDTTIHKNWGNWDTNGVQDLRVYTKRALVGFDTAGGNKLHLNYGGDFANGVEIVGTLTNGGNAVWHAGNLNPVKSDASGQSVLDGFTVKGTLYLGLASPATAGNMVVRNASGQSGIQLAGDNSAEQANVGSYISAAGNAKFDGTVQVGTLKVDTTTLVSNLNVESVNGIKEVQLAKTDSIVELAGYGVYSGVSTQQLAVPALSVTVNAGVVYTNTGKRYAVGTKTQGLTAASATYDRIDAIYIQGSSGGVNEGTIAYTVGTAASTPVAPTLPSDAVSLCTILVKKNVGSILNADITDTRKWKPVQFGTDNKLYVSDLKVVNMTANSGTINIASPVKNTVANKSVIVSVGSTSSVWTHNLNLANYVVRLSCDSPEPHVYWSSKTANSITVNLDDVCEANVTVDISLEAF